ncbi:hypothetical protein MKEN_00996500 [Mycena kentingensis (nom. inval.)]|nr:hypothetical protein MKEN_00996500 [Mycena kentingensis (nom. inval.)]
MPTKTELTAKCAGLKKQLAAAKERIAELEKDLAEAQAGVNAGADVAASASAPAPAATRDRPARDADAASATISDNSTGTTEAQLQAALAKNAVFKRKLLIARVLVRVYEEYRVGVQSIKETLGGDTNEEQDALEAEHERQFKQAREEVLEDLDEEEERPTQHVRVEKSGGDAGEEQAGPLEAERERELKRAREELEEDLEEAEERPMQRVRVE